MFNSGQFNNKPFNAPEESPIFGSFKSTTLTEAFFDSEIISIIYSSFNSETETYSTFEGFIREGVTFASISNTDSTFSSTVLKFSELESVSTTHSNINPIVNIFSNPFESITNSKASIQGALVTYGSFASSNRTRSYFNSVQRTYKEEPKVFDNSEIIFVYDRNERMNLILSDTTTPHFDSWIKEQLNGETTIEFSVMSNSPEVHNIMNDGRIVTRDQDGDYMEFIIRSIEDDDGIDGPIKRVFAEGGEYELLDEFVHSYINPSVDVGTALRAVLSGSRWEVGEISTGLGYKGVEIKNKTTKYAVHYLINLFNCEVRHRVEVEGNRIVRRYIDVLSRRGDSKYKKRFEDGKDILSISRVLNSEGIKTALYGYGASKEGGSRTDFTSIEWSVANGDPVDKPLGQSWIGDINALANWGYQGGRKHKFGFYDGQEEDPATLLLNTWEELKKLTKLRETYDIDVIQLAEIYDISHEKVRLGDTAYSIDKRMNPRLEIENSVIEYRHNLNDRRLSEVTLGMFRSTFDLSERVYDMEQDWNDKRGELDSKPDNEDLDDVRNETQEKVDEAIEEAERLIDEAKEQIEQAQQELEQAVEDLENAMIDLDDAMEVANDVFSNRINQPNSYEGYFEGDVGITGELHVMGTIIGGSGAIIRGTLNANNLNLVSANILNANIQNANITGSLNSVGGTFTGRLVAADGTFTGTLSSVDGTFTGDLIGARIYSQSTAFVGDELQVTNRIMLGSVGNYNISKEISFNNQARLVARQGYTYELAMGNRTIEFNAEELALDGRLLLTNRYYQGYILGGLSMGMTQSNRVVMSIDAGSSSSFPNNPQQSIWLDPGTGNTYFRRGNTNIHTLFGDGTKNGGSIEIDERRYGMSPLDSPQTKISDYIEHVILDGLTQIYLDELYVKSISDIEPYSIFPNNPTVRIIEQHVDYFVVTGEGVTSFEIIGTRKGFEGSYYTDMTKQSEEVKLIEESRNGE